MRRLLVALTPHRRLRATHGKWNANGYSRHVRRFTLTIGVACATAAAQGLPVMELTAGFYRIEAEVAATNQARVRGLMERRSMPPQRGMLFVFPQEAQHCMWMKNTFLPLSVAFLDAGGRIINIEEMQPQTENNHCAALAARYALEMNAGWFAQRGLAAGDTIGGIGQAPRGQ